MSIHHLYDKSFDDSVIHNYLLANLTPLHFLSDAEFDKLKDDLYLLPGKDYYSLVTNLTPTGKDRVLQELARLKQVYFQHYSTIIDFNKEEKILLSPDMFLALYLYTTNLGYPKINSQLRFGKNNSCDHEITLINQAIDILSKYEKFQLAEHQHRLVRHMSLPEEVIHKMILDTIARNNFFDTAFLSTSFNTDGAKQFIGNTTLIIKTNGKCSGTRLPYLSPFPDEAECLFRPGTKFECHGDTPITYDEATKRWTILVCAVNFRQVAETMIMVQKAVKIFKSKLKSKSLTTDLCPVSYSHKTCQNTRHHCIIPT